MTPKNTKVPSIKCNKKSLMKLAQQIVSLSSVSKLYNSEERKESVQYVYAETHNEAMKNLTT